MSFKDCTYRYVEGELLRCANMKSGHDMCENCRGNVHLTCANYVPAKDLCLKWFEQGVSEISQYDDCVEKIVFDNKELQRKWSN